MPTRHCLVRAAGAFALLALIAAASPLAAGPGVWTLVGPEGGTITALAYAPNGRTVYAGTPAGGIFKSLTDGRSWAAAGAGVQGWVKDVEVDPFLPTVVYAATGRGLLKSADGGRSWAALDAALPGTGSPVDALAIAADPFSRGVLYAAIAGGSSRVYRSADHGETWQLSSRGIPAPVLTLGTHPTQRGVVLAGTTDGLYRSADSGQTWRLWGLRGRAIHQVAGDYGDPKVLHALEYAPGPQGDLFLQLFSTDGRGTWSSAPSQPVLAAPGTLLADPRRPGTVYLGAASLHDHGTGVYRVLDGGRQWQELLEGGGVSALALNPLRPGVLLAGRDDALGTGVIARSTDDGSSWSPAGVGLRTFPARQVVADTTIPGLLYARPVCCGLWTTTDRGGVWSPLPGLPDRGAIAFIEAPSLSSTLYLGFLEGLYKSRNGGGTWQALRDPERATALSVAAFAVAPGNPNVIYAGPVHAPAVVKSTDGGLRWEELAASNGLYATVLAAGPGDGKVVYANGQAFTAAGYRDQVRRTADGGATWTKVLDLPGSGRVRDLAVDPHTATWALAAYVEENASTGEPTGGGVYRTRDGGATWDLFRLPGNLPPFTLTLDPRDAARVYAGSRDGRVFVSDDGGATWTPLGSGLPPADVIDLAVDPFDPDTLYAAALADGRFGGGVYAITRRR